MAEIFVFVFKVIKILQKKIIEIITIPVEASIFIANVLLSASTSINVNSFLSMISNYLVVNKALAAL